MSLEEIILDQTGYECITTFAQDFAIAERYGEQAVKDTFNRAFDEWKDNYKYLTELVLILNWKIWQWYENDNALARVYNDLWRTADAYGCDHLKDEELEYFLNTLD